MSGIATAQLRMISQELLDDLNRAFQPPVIDACTPPEQIKWAAAQRGVYDWIVARVSGKQNTGTPSQEVGRPTTGGAIVRIGHANS